MLFDADLLVGQSQKRFDFKFCEWGMKIITSHTFIKAPNNSTRRLFINDKRLAS